MNSPPSHQGALWSCILGIISLCCGLTLFAGIPAVLLGIFELNAVRAGKSPPQNRTLAWVGIAFGSLGCIAGLAFLVYVGVEVYLAMADFFHGLMHSKWF